MCLEHHKVPKLVRSLNDNSLIINFTECRNELMRMGKIIDKMIEPVIKEAQHNVEHGKLHYTTETTCVPSDASEGVSSVIIKSLLILIIIIIC